MSAALFGTKACLPECRHVVARHARQRRIGADARKAVRMMRPIERRRGDERHELARIFSNLAELRAAACPLPFDLLGRKRRVEHDIRHEIERLGEIFLERSALHVRRIHRARRRQRRTELREIVRDLRCAARRRALVEHRRREAGQTGLVHGFDEPPVRTTRSAATTGRPVRWLNITVRPLSSVICSGVGR